MTTGVCGWQHHQGEGTDLVRPYLIAYERIDGLEVVA